MTLPVERTDPAAAIRRAMRDRLDGLQADRLSELPLDELVRRIGRSREAKSRRTNLRRDERAWPAGDVEQGRASFRIEARAVLAELDAVLSPIEDAWLSRRIETRLVHAYLDFANELKRDPGSASLALLDGGLFGVAVLGAVAALAVPANSIRWFLERKAPPEPMLRGTQRERAALADLLARASAHSGFQEGWNLEAYVLRGMLQPLFEAAARENSSQWHVRDGVRRGLSQTLDLLDETRLTDGSKAAPRRHSLELIAAQRVTVVLEIASALPNRDALEALIGAARERLGVARLNMLTAARLVERALAQPGGFPSSAADSKMLMAGLQQRAMPPSDLFAERLTPRNDPV